MEVMLISRLQTDVRMLSTLYLYKVYPIIDQCSIAHVQGGAGLTGGVPALNKLKQLTYLDLSGNAFSGPLPTLPTALWDVDLSSNQLSGAIPASYGEPQSIKLQRVMRL